MCKLPPKETCGKWTYLVYVGSLDPAINFFLVNYLEFKMKFFHGSKGEPQVVDHFQRETCNERTGDLLQNKFDVNCGLGITKSELNSQSLYKNTENFGQYKLPPRENMC